MSEQVLAALARYGLPALFIVVAVAAIGVPLPVTLLLIVTGSLAAQHVINIWWAIAVAAVGASAGDQIGYAIGHWGGKALVNRVTRMVGKKDGLKQLETKAAKLGAAGIFFSRWLVTPLGPWVNFASGIANYSWVRFSVWDFVGETLCAVLYICVGLAFSDRVQAVADVLGNLTWAAVGVAIAALLGWKLFSRQRQHTESLQTR
jgi:membrane protein DedA with SNARE-associated domain